MTIMKCKKCGGTLFIDEWNGWRLTCTHCDEMDRLATDEEINQINLKSLNLDGANSRAAG